MRGHNPAWANLPRRKCDDCGKSYKPKQPLREGTRGFCSDNCRKSYHKHGGAYRKLKVEMQKMVARELQKIRTDLFLSLSPLADKIEAIANRGLADCRQCHGSGEMPEHGTGRKIPCFCMPSSPAAQRANR